MQTPLLAENAPPGPRIHLAWMLVPLLVGLLWLPEIKALWSSWSGDEALSHGPLVPLVVCGLLWTQRERLRSWNAADGIGLAGLIGAACVYILAVWADIDFLKPLALIGMALCGIRYLGGSKIFRTCLGPLGFLIFMIPWPTTLVDRLAFPLQLLSSSYAAMLSGMLGVPIHREGVHLFVMPDLNAKPIYSIVVAQQCSGLTSLMVLLALAYLVAYYTPIKFGWRALLVASVVPLALLTNAVRLTIILLIGSHGKPDIAKWVHDHEGPVLIFFCSLSLMGIRHLLMSRLVASRSPEGKTDVSLPAPDP